MELIDSPLRTLRPDLFLEFQIHFCCTLDMNASELNLSPKAAPPLVPIFMRDTTIHLARYLITTLNSCLTFIPIATFFCFQLLIDSGSFFFSDSFLLFWDRPLTSLAWNPNSIELELCVILTVYQCLAHRKYPMNISEKNERMTKTVHN